MANKRINELALRTPQTTDLMLIGDPTTGYSYKTTLLSALNLGVPTTRTITINGTTFDLSANRSWSVGTVTSVGLTMPSAFNVASSPVTGSGTIAVTAAGLASQYIRGDGTLADFPGGGGSGGASVSYYLNGSVNQGTLGGVTYYEMNKTPILGAGTNFTTSSNGYIASFLTDAGDPALLKIPGGNWNTEFYFAASSGGGTPTYYIELYKYDGTTFTLIASSSSNPDAITGGTSVEQYFTTLAVPETILTATDRLAIRIYVTTAGRTITLHTENSNLCQIITTFTTGLTALNGLTAQVQYFATGSAGTDFNISSSTATHTFNIPTASATNRGLLSTADWTTFNNKVSSIIAGNAITVSNASGNVTINHADTSGADPGATITGSNVFRSIVLDTYGHITGLSWSPFLISDLGGTAISSPSNGQVLSYNGTNWVNSSLSGLSIITGSGTTNWVPKFTSASAIGLSNIFDSGSFIGVFTATDNLSGAKLQVSGAATFSSTITATRGIFGTTGTGTFGVHISDNDQSNVRLRFTNTGTGGQAFSLVGGNPGASNAGFAIYDETNAATRLYISSTGAATFNGSVTINASATSGLFLTPTSGTESPNVTFVSSTNQYNIDNSGGNLRFFTENVGGGNGVVRATLNSSGNLGLGVTPSAWGSGYTALQIGSDSSFMATTNGGDLNLQTNAYWDGSVWRYIRSSVQASSYFQTLGQHIWRTAPSGTAGNSFTFTQAMTLNASGNLGLGVTPSAWSGFTVIELQGGYIGGGGSTYFEVGQNNYYDGSFRYKTTAAATLYEQISGSHRWYNAPSGTAGNAITFTQAMTLDASGNLGIGLTSPVARLQVVGANGAGLRIDQGNYNYYGAFTHQWLNSGFTSTFMTLDNSGRLGIGTTAPAAVLEVAGTSATTDFRISRTVSSSTYLSISAPGGTPSTSIIGINGSNVMALNSSGRVLIGTTTDNTVDLLQVAGSGVFNSGANGSSLTANYTANDGGINSINAGTLAANRTAQLRLGNGTTFFGANDRTYQLINIGTSSTAADFYIQYWNGSTYSERLRITSGGDLQVTKTTGTLLDIRATNTGGTAELKLNPVNNNNYSLYTSGSTDALQFLRNGSEQMRITNVGEVYIAGTTDQGAYNLQVNGTGVWGAGAYVNGSDIRLKENISPIKTALEYVNKMNPISFKYKESYSKDQNIQPGFIAQELKELFKNEIWVNGIVSEGTDYLNVAYQNIIPLLTKAIQELKTELDTLKK